MDKWQAVQAFWGGFSIPAYDENTVPDGAVMPYITYETSASDFGNALTQTASLWYHSPSWADISKKADAISDRITRGGIMIPYGESAVWIRKGSPFAQRMDDPNDDMIRRIVLNVNIEFLD